MSTEHNESVFAIFQLGIRTWLAEVQWLGKSLMTRFEISRLEKELNREYGVLGRIAEAPRGRMEAKEMSLRQIEFLKEEIETLKSDARRDRDERMSQVLTKQD